MTAEQRKSGKEDRLEPISNPNGSGMNDALDLAWAFCGKRFFIVVRQSWRRLNFCVLETGRGELFTTKFKGFEVGFFFSHQFLETPVVHGAQNGQRFIPLDP